MTEHLLFKTTHRLLTNTKIYKMSQSTQSQDSSPAKRYYTNVEVGVAVFGMVKNYFGSKIWTAEEWNANDFAIHVLPSGRGLMVDEQKYVFAKNGVNFDNFHRHSDQYWEDSTVSFDVPKWLSTELIAMKKLYFSNAVLGVNWEQWLYRLDNFELHVLADGSTMMVSDQGFVVNQIGESTGRLIDMPGCGDR